LLAHDGERLLESKRVILVAVDRPAAVGARLRPKFMRS